MDKTLHRVATKEREEIKGRPHRRWQDDIAKEERTIWNRKATDKKQWKALVEGCTLKWMDKA